jgi:thioesterase domain-containing protein
LKELDIMAVIVIQDSTTNYLLPVTGDFSAHCYKPDQEQIAKLKNMLKNKGKARLALKAEIREGERIAVSFTARYVVCLAQQGILE